MSHVIAAVALLAAAIAIFKLFRRGRSTRPAVCSTCGNRAELCTCAVDYGPETK